MAVVEYKHHVYLNDHRRHIPGFITDPEHWHNPVNHSFIGWAKEDADYYIPWSTLKILTKEDFVQRLLVIHNINPIEVFNENNDLPGMNFVQLTSEQEVRQYAEEWYDNFVNRHSTNN